MSRPKLPTRSNSKLKGDAPSDAAKPDDDAVEDVYRAVEYTGSLEAAARKLKQAAMWEDDPEEAAYIQHQQQQQHQHQQQRQQQENQQRQQKQQQHEYHEVFEDEDDEAQEQDEEEDAQVVHLQEVLPGLWIGDLVAAMDTEGLEQRGIKNVLSLLRPALKFPPQLAQYPLEIDDSADTDILTHLPSCVAWIAQALAAREAGTGSVTPPVSREVGSGSVSPSGSRQAGSGSGTVSPPGSHRVTIDPRAQPVKPGGVLVHCQAGMSRSATVVAAYLMTVLDLGPVEAVEMLKEKRPVVDPSDTFWYQLGLFYNADGKVTLRDRSTRQFYMERTTSHFMNGDGGAPQMDMMAKYPATPTPSNPPTPMGGLGRRKIRCKMCRRHLAVREHMMDHILDQSPVSRPRTPSNFALPSPAGSIGALAERRASIVSEIINPLTGLPGATPRSRHASMSGSATPVMTTMTTIPSSPRAEKDKPPTPTNGAHPRSRSGSMPSAGGAALPPGLSLTAASPEVHTGGQLMSDTHPTPNPASSGSRRSASIGHSPGGASHSRQSSGNGFKSADELASRLPPHLQALRGGSSVPSPARSSSPTSSPDRESSHGFPTPDGSSSTSVPRRKMSLLAMTPSESPHDRNGESGFGGILANSGTPILVNPKCSGYFVEPLTWMEPVLRNGDISGKLVCPNEKCGVKIGNFDWAGVQCGCKEWVTPGFCISRSKVDEVW